MELEEIIKNSGIGSAELKIITCAIAVLPDQTCIKITETLISLEHLRASEPLPGEILEPLGKP